MKAIKRAADGKVTRKTNKIVARWLRWEPRETFGWLTVTLEREDRSREKTVYEVEACGSNVGRGFVLTRCEGDGFVRHETHVSGEGYTTCTCESHKRQGQCKHASAFLALAAAGRLGSIPG